MILRINDHSGMREIFAGFQMQGTNIDYNIGGGGKGVEKKELII